jgi:hypothetical protein
MKTFKAIKSNSFLKSMQNTVGPLLSAITLGFIVCATAFIAGPLQVSAANDLAMPDGFTEVSATDAFLPRQEIPHDVAAMADGPVKTSIINLLAEGSMDKYADNMFRPSKAITRAELAVAMSQAFQLPTNKNKIKIKDVKTSNWAYSSIKRAIKYLPLYRDGSFRPSAAATREDVASALVAVSGVNKTGSNPANIDLMFEDAKSVSPDVKETLSVAFDNGLMKAYKDGDKYYLKPQGFVTRAELAYLLDQAMSKIGTGLKTVPKTTTKKTSPIK